jgi:GWxTD domain-containing protein
MKKFIILIISILILGIYEKSLFSIDELLPQQKEWLELVAPIITKTEREIFLKLRTPEERDKFIQFFWKQRDPRPDTAENEFYKEYMERVRFVNQTFHDSPKKGSLTERGYYYLLLGPPLERTTFTTHSQIWPLEL